MLLLAWPHLLPLHQGRMLLLEQELATKTEDTTLVYRDCRSLMTAYALCDTSELVMDTSELWPHSWDLNTLPISPIIQSSPNSDNNPHADRVTDVKTRMIPAYERQLLVGHKSS